MAWGRFQLLMFVSVEQMIAPLEGGTTQCQIGTKSM